MAGDPEGGGHEGGETEGGKGGEGGGASHGGGGEPGGGAGGLGDAGAGGGGGYGAGGETAGIPSWLPTAAPALQTAPSPPAPPPPPLPPPPPPPPPPISGPPAQSFADIFSGLAGAFNSLFGGTTSTFVPAATPGTASGGGVAPSSAPVEGDFDVPQGAFNVPAGHPFLDRLRRQNQSTRAATQGPPMTTPGQRGQAGAAPGTGPARTSGRDNFLARANNPLAVASPGSRRFSGQTGTTPHPTTGQQFATFDSVESGIGAGVRTFVQLWRNSVDPARYAAFNRAHQPTAADPGLRPHEGPPGSLLSIAEQYAPWSATQRVNNPRVYATQWARQMGFCAAGASCDDAIRRPLTEDELRAALGGYVRGSRAVEGSGIALDDDTIARGISRAFT